MKKKKKKIHLKKINIIVKIKYNKLKNIKKIKKKLIK